MKKLLQQLKDTEVLSGLGCQENIKPLKNCIRGFGPDILSLHCAELQAVYDEIIDKSSAIFKRRDKQILADKAAAPIPVDTRPAPAPAARPSTLPGLTHADKGCL